MIIYDMIIHYYSIKWLGGCCPSDRIRAVLLRSNLYGFVSSQGTVLRTLTCKPQNTLGHSRIFGARHVESGTALGGTETHFWLSGFRWLHVVHLGRHLDPFNAIVEESGW